MAEFGVDSCGMSPARSVTVWACGATMRKVIRRSAETSGDTTIGVFAAATGAGAGGWLGADGAAGAAGRGWSCADAIGTTEEAAKRMLIAQVRMFNVLSLL